MSQQVELVSMTSVQRSRGCVSDSRDPLAEEHAFSGGGTDLCARLQQWPLISWLLQQTLRAAS